jgi:pyrroline-5-carboxylate reductase
MNCKNKSLIGFIGAGNMGTAIIKGISGSAELISKVSVSAFDVNAEKLENLKNYNCTPLNSANDVVKTCKYIFLAVKPQMMKEVLNGIASDVTEDTVFVSIAAGVTDSFIKENTIANAKVILVMPNTPLMLGEGATALAKCERVDDEEFEIVKSVFDSCGVTEVIDKTKMKEIIAVNSSSPAFIYLFAKGFLEYANEVDIDEEVAKNLLAKALIGSAKMITDSGYSVDELIKMVSSPGGTTLAGLDEFYKGNLEEVVKNACKSCTKRAYELSK